MINRLTIDGSILYVHLAEISLKSTKSFTHGGLVIDTVARTVTFGRLPPVAFPDGFIPAAGATLNLQLVGPDGGFRKQTRSGVLRPDKRGRDILRIPGKAKTESKFTAADGWGQAIYKFRAYVTHPGIETDGDIPEWLKESNARQKAFWNRLAWLCREARHKCSPVSTEEIAKFVQETILPAIDAFNDALRDPKQRMKHPAKLKTEFPGVDGLWKFVGSLRWRIEKGRQVPDGLLERVVAYAEQFKADYTPLNSFLKNLNAIAEREANALPMPIEGVPFEEDHRIVQLRHYEVRPVISVFKAVLARRKTAKTWSEGWPLIKYPDAPKAENWGLHYYFNKAGLDTALLETEKGVPGLTFGPPLDPSTTGHAELHGLAAKKRKLRAAEISIQGYNNESLHFRFAVLQHRALPPSSHVKEWKLIFQDGKLWLCLQVEFQRPVSLTGQLAAGLDIGWRRTEGGIRFGTLYEPASKTVRELTIDLQKSPKDHKDRTPFRIDMGPTRIEKRHIAKLLPNWKPGNPIPNALEIRKARVTLRSSYKDAAKVLLRKHLGERLPAWFDRAGVKGLFTLGEEFKDDAVVHEILDDLKQKNGQLEKPDAEFSSRTTRRLTNGVTGRIEYGQLQVAHDVCLYLQQKGINLLFIEDGFLSKVAQQRDNENPEPLKRSQKYRQFAAVSRFVRLLKNTAAKYGVTIQDIPGANTTRICSKCNAVNASTASEMFVCSNCRAVHKQDENAAINLVRFGTDPKLAAWALHAGKA